MPLILLWLLGVPLSLIVVLFLRRALGPAAARVPPWTS